MIDDVHPDLITFVDSVDFHSATSYAVLGHRRDVPSQAAVHDGQDSPLVSALASDLYERLYIRPVVGAVPRPIAWLTHREFLAALSVANAGTGTWEQGWIIRHVAKDGRVAVGQSDLNFWPAATDLYTPGGRVAIGESCLVRVPKELRYLVKGYYFALGDAEEEEGTSSRNAGKEARCRFYWHLTREVAVPFIEEASTRLNAAAVPFRLKVLSNPAAYHRADAGVLYINRRHALQVGGIIARIHKLLAKGLRPEVPMLTRRLANGLALADDSPSSTSFGEQRCQLIARGLCRSFIQGDASSSSRQTTLAALFRQEGFDPRHPYLAPDSRLDDFLASIPVLDASVHSLGNSRDDAESSRPSGPLAVSPLDAAVLIGRTICRTAHWDADGRLCSWMGRSPLEASSPRAITPTSAALDSGLYAGTAGMALFLAELHALTNDADCRRTAVGAINRSLRLALHHRAGLASPLSFYSGHLGVAFAAHRVAMITGEGGLHEDVVATRG